MDQPAPLPRGAERLSDEQREKLFAKLLSADPNEDIAAARTRGYNRIVKHVGRIAFGFRNPEKTALSTVGGLHPPFTAGHTQ